MSDMESIRAAKKLRAKGRAYKEIADILGVRPQVARQYVETETPQEEPAQSEGDCDDEGPGYFDPNNSHKYLARYIVDDDWTTWLATDDFRAATKDVLREIKESPYKWYTYAHYMDGEPAYIGKGSGKRISCIWRTPAWRNALIECDEFEPRVLSWHDKESDAYLVERALIKTYSPTCNQKIQ